LVTWLRSWRLSAIRRHGNCSTKGRVL